VSVLVRLLTSTDLAALALSTNSGEPAMSLADQSLPICK
jgi:hypothetical protein